MHVLNEKLINTLYSTFLNYNDDIGVVGPAQQLGALKNDYPNVKIAQWFLDPLNKNGPDFERNKKRILDKIDFIDKNIKLLGKRL